MKVLRVFHHWTSSRKLELFAIELLLIPLGATAAASAAGSRGAALALIGLSLGALFQASFYLADLYDPRVAAADRGDGERLLRGIGFALLAGACLAPAWPRATSPGTLLAAFAGALAAVVLARGMVPLVFGAPQRVVVVGQGRRARALERALAEEVGVTLIPWPDSGLPPLERGTARPAALVLAHERDDELPEAELLLARVAGVPVLSATSLYERLLRRIPVPETPPMELVLGDGFQSRRLDAFVKRALDLVAASAIAVVAAPLVLLCAVAIRLDSKGPIFYRQERVGRGGRHFTLTKLRTMRADAEREGRPLWARMGDDRVTSVGRLLRRTRLDELPQILSVLRGEMSLVGPRPERPFFVNQIARQIPFYRLREEIKPGITGWAQICYPYGASIEDARAKLEYDLYYLKNRSLFLDLAIIFHTVRHVLAGRGAR